MCDDSVNANTRYSTASAEINCRIQLRNNTIVAFSTFCAATIALSLANPAYSLVAGINSYLAICSVLLIRSHTFFIDRLVEFQREILLKSSLNIDIPDWNDQVHVAKTKSARMASEAGVIIGFSSVLILSTIISFPSSVPGFSSWLFWGASLIFAVLAIIYLSGTVNRREKSLNGVE